jgi:hypothetical protein
MKSNLKQRLKGVILGIAMLPLSGMGQMKASKIWTAEKANEWYASKPLPIGANFLPSTAINQLEMWQAETFDTATISRELGWAAAIGMNTMRVYLHDLAWKADAKGFKKRMNTYLGIASRHGISTVFTIFDDCWNPDANIGLQPAPKPGIHNSGWVRSPVKSVHDDSTQWGYLKDYVQDVLSSFKKDKRILMWDLYNEPGNSSYGLTSMPLLQKVFEWAWVVRPDQPLSSGTWFNNEAFNNFVLGASDVITFHNYSDTKSLIRQIETLKKLNRPVICTEYMARTRNSLFQTHLPIFVEQKVGAINWGLVAGKSNTIYAWDTPLPDGSEPKLWFHDIFRKDGSPYREEEAVAIKKAAGLRK